MQGEKYKHTKKERDVVDHEKIDGHDSSRFRCCLLVAE